MSKCQKHCVIGFNNLEFSPYANLYLDILNNIGVKFDFILLKRNLRFIQNENHIEIPWRDYTSNKLINKSLNFIKFKLKVTRVLLLGNYDKVIVLTTIPAFLLSIALIAKYKKKYVIDIRDYTLESILFFRIIMRFVFKHSLVNIISSPDFKTFLPKNDYMISHNLRIEAIPKTNYEFTPNSTGKIVIGYVGSLSYYDQCINLIKLIANDNRFEFHFYGNEEHPYKIKKYIESNRMYNIKYNGIFFDNEKEEIYKSIDIIFNCYGNNNPLLTHAISNKYYDGLIYKKPFLTSPNTTMSYLLEKFCFNIDFKLINNLDLLYDWYSSIISDEINLFYSKRLSECISQQKILVTFLKNKLS